MTAPTVADVDRISATADPLLRNLQITQCYHELSQAVVGWGTGAANWCTFATWASKQAGQTIRGEDLADSIAERVHAAPEVAEAIAGALRSVTGALHDLAHDRILRALDVQGALARASDAVARGNRKVFAEIGREFARFVAAFAHATAYEADRIDAFGAALRTGDPPDGQRLLRAAFAAYGRARFQGEAKARAELMLYANLMIGLHEQTRLQPEITAALDAAFEHFAQSKRAVLAALLPGVWLRFRHHLGRALGRKLPLDEAVDRLADAARRHVRALLTAHLMTLRVASEVLHLGRDLRDDFPAALRQIANVELQQLLDRIDRTPDSLAGSGAHDWSDLDERMHFIADFFRAWHERASTFEAPFTEEQTVELEAGRRPRGPL